MSRYNRFTSIIFLAFSLMILLVVSAHASVVISGTRVIYLADQKEVTVKVTNTGTGPVVLQSWIDSGDINAKPETLKVPFVLTPPINRVEPNKSQTLRVSYTGGVLPTDKESVFWLNVLEIPAKGTNNSNQNYLQMAFRSRIKLFYRPEGLSSKPENAAQSLIWTKTPQGLKVTNPTPFHVSLVSVAVNGGGKQNEVEGDMVSPKGSLSFKLPVMTLGTKVDFDYVNDFGAVNSLSQTITP
nr:fimbria/pilus periplasmic chaperone [Yersinia frederiksenii]